MHHLVFIAGLQSEPKDQDEQSEHHQSDEEELGHVGKSITELPQPSSNLNPPEVTLTFFSNLLRQQTFNLLRSCIVNSVRGFFPENKRTRKRNNQQTNAGQNQSAKRNKNP
jgi:hypothetical protein